MSLYGKFRVREYILALSQQRAQVFITCGEMSYYEFADIGPERYSRCLPGGRVHRLSSSLSVLVQEGSLMVEYVHSLDLLQK